MAATASSGPVPLRYLPGAQLEACLPGIEERVDLAAAAMRALGRGEAEMPPKVGVHPRAGALLHAMPAWLRSEDVVGMKWVAAFPGNRSRGLPAITGLVVLNDSDTGLSTWIMDAARITAVRTAAVSGVAIRLFAPPGTQQVAILGAGVQARSHLEVVGALLPAAQVTLFDRHPNRAAEVAADANMQSGHDWVTPTDDARQATARSQVVITVATLGATSQAMTRDWLAPGALVVSIDFATYMAASLAREANAFVVDDRDQFLAYRAGGYFDDYPEPTATLGEMLDNSSGAQPDGNRPTAVNHLGVGLADVLFADAISRRADQLGLGLELPR